MIPDGNNVYGIITAPQGLQPVLRAVEEVVTGGRASIYRSQFNGSETLPLQLESADFESDHLDNGVHHLFNGGVDGLARRSNLLCSPVVGVAVPVGHRTLLRGVRQSATRS